MILFVVVLVVVAAVVSAIAPRERDVTDRAPVVSEAPAAPAAPVVSASLPRTAEVRARVGDVVQLRVRNDAADVVQLPALGLEEPVEAGLDARLVFDADREGTFAVVLRETGKRVGTVTIAAPAGG